MMKKIFQAKTLHLLTLVLVIIQPLIDMDYLFYDFLDSLGLPRFSTIIRFLVIPALIIWSFVLREKKKKPVFWIACIYGICFGAFFFLHCKQALALFPRLDLPENYAFNTWQELTYVLTLVIPYGITYLCYHEHFDFKELKLMSIWTSIIISFPIVIGDLYVFGKSTYYKDTVGNVFTWFNGIYTNYHPRTLASKFFFNEGNTLGILLFMVLPLLYYFFFKEQEKKKKIRLGVLIVIQSLAMQILATRVATYGAVVIPIIFLVFYLFDQKILQKGKLQKNIFIFCICVASVFGGLLNWTPAIQNQKVDAKNDVALLSNPMADIGMADLELGKDLIPGTPEYINFYVFMFETYGIKARYIQSVPSMYYIDYYNYQHDPKFWVDVTFMDVYDRVSGRQIETIFFNYKYALLSQKEKLLGMGYSTFMNGSIVLEQDFKQQLYTLGYIGDFLCCIPWILVALYGVWMLFKNFKKMMDLQTLCLCLSFAGALGSGWISGHTLDQFMTTTFMALLAAVLLNHIADKKKEEKQA